VDNLTPWSDAGVTSYGVASIFNERRVKVQWIGTLAAFAPGQVVPVTLMPELRRGLTQSQSVLWTRAIALWEPQWPLAPAQW
jgi:hypothetical protein